MDDSSMEGVLTQFRDMLSGIDESAVIAKGAQTQAEQAHAAYGEASRGTNDPMMRKAVVDSRTAAEKSGKTARLLSEAAEHFVTYINIIAPGALPPRSSAPEAMPAGELLVTQAMSRRERAAGLVDRASKQADNVKDAATEVAKAVGDGTKSILKMVKGEPPPTGVSSTTTPTVVARAEQPAQMTPQDAVSALTVTLLGMALVGKASLEHIKRRRARKGSDGNE